ncbi:MAG: YebC/PmpR family DNA-binding transcriptional regulator [Planctomycetes bacterium]|nr:YebC/PmpR family DNA-binding transcriptional regulator [Planctomycetota bacterium]
MSGHSHWASIKHKKGAADAKKGKVFSKMAKLIMIAAKQGGGDPNTNIKLKYAMDKAREYNMPKDNVERAVKKGTGELEGVIFEETSYEGYGPSGVAVMAQVLTDNRKRTTAELRKIFEQYGGNLGEANCVAFMFELKGRMSIPVEKVNEDDLMTAVLDAGAENMENIGDAYEITCEPKLLESVKSALIKKGYNVTSGDVSKVPKSLVKVEEPNVANKIINLMDALQEHDDVQDVFANFDIPDEIIASLKRDEE